MNLKTIQTEANAVPIIESKNVELAFFSNRKKALIDLKSKNQGEPLSYKLSEDGLEYQFTEPMFVSVIEVYGENPKVTFEVKLLNSSISRIEANASIVEDKSTSIPFKINALIQGFKISSHKKKGFFDTLAKVSGIKVSGWLPFDLQELENSAKQFVKLAEDLPKAIQEKCAQLDQEKATLDSAQAAFLNGKAERDAELNKLNKTITAYNQQALEAKTLKETAEAELATVTKTLETQNTQKTKNETVIKEQGDKIAKLNNLEIERNAELELKTKQSAELSQEVKELQNDKSLFATDMKGITKQGNSQIWFYTLFALLPIFLIGGTLAWYSVHSAGAVYDTFVSHTELHAYAGWLMAFKSILVGVAWAIYFFLAKAAKPVISTILQIHARRMRLSEITMLAATFSDSALSDMDLISDEEKIEARTNMRMQLIREYFSGKLEPIADHIENTESTLSASVPSVGLTTGLMQKQSKTVNNQVGQI